MGKKSKKSKKKRIPAMKKSLNLDAEQRDSNPIFDSNYSLDISRKVLEDRRGSLSYLLGRFSEPSPEDGLFFLPLPLNEEGHLDSETLERVSTNGEAGEYGFICRVASFNDRPVDSPSYTANSIKSLAEVLLKNGYRFKQNDFIGPICSGGPETITFCFGEGVSNVRRKKFLVGTVKFRDAEEFQNYLVAGTISEAENNANYLTEKHREED